MTSFFSDSAALAPDMKWKKKQAAYSGLSFGLSQFAVFGTFALIFWAGIKLMLGGKLGFTDFFVALLSVMFSSFGAGQTGADFSARRSGLEVSSYFSWLAIKVQTISHNPIWMLQAASRLFEISDGIVDGEDDPLSSSGNRPVIRGKVCFKDCEFSYPTRPGAMIYYKKGDRGGFSLDIDSRKSVAFTGRSGCGKSTALQLLLRFYRVNSGAVEVDDSDVTDINIGHLRDHIGYVGQMPVLFAGSIRQNIKVSLLKSSWSAIAKYNHPTPDHDNSPRLIDMYTYHTFIA